MGWGSLAVQTFRLECLQSPGLSACVGWTEPFTDLPRTMDAIMQGRAWRCIYPGGGGATIPSTAVRGVYEDTRVHPVWGEEAPGGWWEAAAGPRSKDAGMEPRPEGGPLTRAEGGGRGCRGHGGRQKVSGRRAAAPLARKGLIKVQDN